MKQITDEDIENTLAKFDGLDEDAMDRLFEDMDKKQKLVVDYLYEVEGEDFHNEERALLVDTALVGWFIIKETIGCESQVSDDILDERLEKNSLLLEIDDEDEDESEDDLIKIFSEFNEQPVLMMYLIGLIINEPKKNGGKIREQLVFIIILHLKTVIDCLVADKK